jgi:hypothetical protein
MVLVLGLLVATAAAFAITESLKLTKSPITRTFVSQRLSPTCHCDRRGATIKFWLRKSDVLTLSVVDSARDEVKRLVDATLAHGKWNTFLWKGDSSRGRIARDGTYYVRVHLQHAHRTILLPNPIELDTVPPEIRSAKPSRTNISPDGDGHAEWVAIRYHLSEKAHALVFFKGRQVIRSRFAPRSGSVQWFGRVQGRPLRQGTYRLVVGAEDLAGNVTSPADRKVVLVHVVYVALARHQIGPVKAGTRFGVGVTVWRSFDWSFAGLHGSSPPGQLVLRAPQRPGTYRLVVSERGHRDSAIVTVVPRR